ncbi:DUF2586 domain-containing protein [Kistimonas scapharcae]|uniref:DUF2586 domain-containing protein n=1 Tax=Kistimonas scapharcae TaxID=1036133 RepID=A0ABP8UZD1_9GAMM
MATGQVNVNNINRNQGSFPDIERQFLYIGVGGNAANNDKLLPLSGDSDLDALLGNDASDLKTQLIAARQNAGQNWQAYVIPIVQDGDWEAALDSVMEKPHDLDVEAVAVCTFPADKAAVESAYAKMEDIRSRFARFMTCHMAVPGIAADEDWTAYLAKIKALNNGVAANRVSLVPQLHGNNLGVVTGRLCNRAVSIADTPMRVNTGPLVGLGDDPKDSAGTPLTMGIITELSKERFSVPQWYAGYNGMYWADHMMLDNPGGDFQVYENIRVLDYLARRVRVLAIGKIADRSLNSTPKSIAFNTTYFMRPLRESSRSTEIGGQPFPAMIQPPEDGDIVITWISLTEVEIYIQAAPYQCPKKIGVFLMLDLARGLESAA